MTQDKGSLPADLRAFISAEFVLSPDQQFDGQTNLVEAGIIDSFGLIQLIAFTEKRTGVKFSDDDLVSPELTSIDGIIRLLESKI